MLKHMWDDGYPGVFPVRRLAPAPPAGPRGPIRSGPGPAPSVPPARAAAQAAAPARATRAPRRATSIAPPRARPLPDRTLPEPTEAWSMKPEAVQAPEGRRDFAPASSVWDDLKVLRAMWLATGHSVKGLEHQ